MPLKKRVLPWADNPNPWSRYRKACSVKDDGTSRHMVGFVAGNLWGEGRQFVGWALDRGRSARSLSILGVNPDGAGFVWKAGWENLTFDWISGPADPKECCCLGHPVDWRIRSSGEMAILASPFCWPSITSRISSAVRSPMARGKGLIVVRAGTAISAIS